MSRAYNIGQVLYVASQKSKRVIPVQIVERIVKSTLQGEQVIYKVVGPKGNGPLDLSKINGEKYTDIDVVRNELRQKAITAIDKMIDEAIQIAHQNFNHQSRRAPIDDDDGLMFDEDPAPVHTNGAAQPQAEEPVTLEEGEVEFGVGPDGKPVRARIGKVTESPAPPIPRV
jgi:hypothetical protein